MSIVKSNVNNIRDQIEAKIGKQPFLASQNSTSLTVTDLDTFPYPRFYRGIYQIEEPVVFEREAGWRQRHDECYIPKRIINSENPKYCWQVPCSTIFPCRAPNGHAAKEVSQQYNCINISR